MGRPCRQLRIRHCPGFFVVILGFKVINLCSSQYLSYPGCHHLLKPASEYSALNLSAYDGFLYQYLAVMAGCL